MESGFPKSPCDHKEIEPALADHDVARGQSAALCRVAPAATAATTRSRRSTDKVEVIEGLPDPLNLAALHDALGGLFDKTVGLPPADITAGVASILGTRMRSEKAKHFFKDSYSLFKIQFPGGNA